MQDLVGVHRQECRGAAEQHGEEIQAAGAEDDLLAPDELRSGEHVAPGAANHRVLRRLEVSDPSEGQEKKELESRAENIDGGSARKRDEEAAQRGPRDGGDLEGARVPGDRVGERGVGHQQRRDARSGGPDQDARARQGQQKQENQRQRGLVETELCRPAVLFEHECYPVQKLVRPAQRREVRHGAGPEGEGGEPDVHHRDDRGTQSDQPPPIVPVGDCARRQRKREQGQDIDETDESERRRRMRPLIDLPDRSRRDRLAPQQGEKTSHEVAAILGNLERGVRFMERRSGRGGHGAARSDAKNPASGERLSGGVARCGSGRMRYEAATSSMRAKSISCVNGLRRIATRPSPRTRSKTSCSPKPLMTSAGTDSLTRRMA